MKTPSSGGIVAKMEREKQKISISMLGWKIMAQLKACSRWGNMYFNNQHGPNVGKLQSWMNTAIGHNSQFSIVKQLEY